MAKRLIFVLTVVMSMFCSVLSAGETIRILAIGNSFSEDAVENYLHSIGKADDVTLIIGNMYIGGCSLETHWNNATNDAGAYSYRKIDASGTKKTTANYSISQALADENWDYISFQQVSQNSGVYNTYFPYLTNLLAYVKEKVTNPNVQYALHMTWAYSKDSTHSGFVNYGKDQMMMYNAIINAATTAAETVGIKILIPSGTAIQNGRTSYIGDNFCRDGYHLNLDYGRYTAACTWYEKLTGKSVVGNTYRPANVLPDYITIAQKAAHAAVENPLVVTDLSEETSLPDPETFSLTAPVNIDFGNASQASASPWNNITSSAAGTSLLGLLDMDGGLTPFKIEITSKFGGVNTNGPSNGLTLSTWALPKEATSDSFYGNAGDAFNGQVIVTGSLKLSNLNPHKAYDFSMLASRLSTSDNRETYFEITGLNASKVTVNSANNTLNLAKVESIQPKPDGTIDIVVGAGANNTNTNKFFYLNALQIKQNPNFSSIQSSMDQEKSVRLHSNPVVDYINVLGLTQDARYQYTIHLADGKQVKQGSLKNIDDNIDVSSLSASYYILVLKSDVFSEKIQLPFLKRN